MVDTIIKGIKISGISAAVSNTWTSLESFIGDDIDEGTLKKFTKTTGVKGRYDAGINQTAADFCVAAAKQVLQNKNVDSSEIGLIVYVTMSPDYITGPATACIIGHRLGASEDCLAFDVNLGCSGFIYGLNIASSILKSNNTEKALLVCGDTNNKDIYGFDGKRSHSDIMLFGDAGAAVLLEKSKEADDIYVNGKTDGAGYSSIISPYGGFRHPGIPVGNKNAVMDEFAVFNFSTSKAPELIVETMEKLGTSPDSYDCLALHQANLLIMQRIAKKSGFSSPKMLVSIDDYGNTSSASIPISLVKCFGSYKEQKKIHVLMSGYGIGLSWGVADVYLDTGDIYPIVHTDEYYEDCF